MAMEGLASAFTAAGLAGQLPFALLVAAVLSSSRDRARIYIIAAGAIGCTVALLLSKGGVVTAFWWAVLMISALIMIGRVLLESARCRFTTEEEDMIKGPFSGLTRPHARHLLDQGFWLTGRPGDVLTREDENVSHLFYLAAGEAKVVSHGRQVGTCRAGDLIGEVTLLTQDRASATVTLTTAARFWCAPANVLRPYLDTHESVRRALERGFTEAMRAKLKASNERMREATDWRPPEGAFAPTPQSVPSADLPPAAG